ncbi:hypothetical protein P3S67_019987 [Capsicum chacoense]
MTCEEGVGSDSEEEQNQLILPELASMEKVKLLKQQMAELYQAWLNGQTPPSSIPGLAHMNDPNPAKAQTRDPFYPPGFSPYANVFGVIGTSTMGPPNPSVINNPFFTSVAPAIVGLQSITQNNMGEPSHDLLYPPKMTFKPQNPHYYAHQHDSPIVIEKIVKNEEQDEMARKSVSYKDLCMFPDVHLPLGFKMPKFDKYEGHGDPVAHLKKFWNQLRGAGGKEELLMAYFGESSEGVASEWFIDQDISRWHVWDDMARDFVQQFQYNIEIVPDRTTLTNMRKKTTESFREYAIRWREQAARVRPLIKESEIIDIFLQAQEPDYFHHLLSTIGNTFVEVIKIGEMVESGIKSEKIISQAALKATTQAIQSGSGSFDGNKRKEDVATIIPGPRQNWRGYSIYNAQSYVRTPSYPQWSAPIPQNHSPIPQTYPSPSRLDFRSKPNNEKRQKLRDSFTPIEESYTSLFQKLRQKDIITPLLRYTPDPQSRNFDPNV